MKALVVSLLPRSKPYYGWLIVFLAFLSVNTYGVFYSYSAFIKPLETDLETSRAGISAAFTIFLAVYSICAGPMGWLSDRYGPRKTLWLAGILIGGGIALCSRITSLWQLYLLFGFVAGIGHGAIYVVPASTVSRWFVARRGLAVGLTVCGLGVGLVVMPPIVAQVIEAEGWRNAFLMLGIIAFGLNALAGSLISAKPQDKGLKAYGETEIQPLAQVSARATRDYKTPEALKTRAFWLIYIVCVFAFGAEQMVLVHAMPFSETMGISPIAASLGLSFLGIGTAIGRVLPGALSDRIGRLPTMIMGLSIETVAIFVLLAVKSQLTLYLVMFFLGFGYGGFGVLCAVMFGDYFGLKNLGAIIGVFFTSGIFAGILGPLMGGVVYDLTQSYFLAIMIAAISCVVSVILATRIKPPPKLPIPEQASS